MQNYKITGPVQNIWTIGPRQNYKTIGLVQNIWAIGHRQSPEQI